MEEWKEGWKIGCLGAWEMGWSGKDDKRDKGVKGIIGARGAKGLNR
jgi:hypothetical protein